MLIFISGSKVVLGDDFGQYDIKKHCFMSFFAVFGQTPPRNSVTMATAKVPDDQNYLKLYIIYLKLYRGRPPPPSTSSIIFLQVKLQTKWLSEHWVSEACYRRRTVFS